MSNGVQEGVQGRGVGGAVQGGGPGANAAVSRRRARSGSASSVSQKAAAARRGRRLPLLQAPLAGAQAAASNLKPRLPPSSCPCCNTHLHACIRVNLPCCPPRCSQRRPPGCSRRTPPHLHVCLPTHLRVCLPTHLHVGHLRNLALLYHVVGVCAGEARRLQQVGHLLLAAARQGGKGASGRSSVRKLERTGRKRREQPCRLRQVGSLT